MSFWANNPELYDEIIVNEAKRRGIVAEDDEGLDYEIMVQLAKRNDFYEVAEAAEADFWASKIDRAMMRKEDEQISKII